MQTPDEIVARTLREVATLFNNWNTVGNEQSFQNILTARANEIDPLLEPTPPLGPDRETQLLRKIEKLIAARDETLDLITRYGGIDGSHHKQWVLDQIVRKLVGPEAYEQWVKDYEAGPDDLKTYSWDTGIAS